MQDTKDTDDDRYINRLVNDTYLVVSRTQNFPRTYVGTSRVSSRAQVRDGQRDLQLANRKRRSQQDDSQIYANLEHDSSVLAKLQGEGRPG